MTNDPVSIVAMRRRNGWEWIIIRDGQGGVSRSTLKSAAVVRNMLDCGVSTRYHSEGIRDIERYADEMGVPAYMWNDRSRTAEVHVPDGIGISE